jgi:hypothetical protein
VVLTGATPRPWLQLRTIGTASTTTVRVPGKGRAAGIAVSENTHGDVAALVRFCVPAAGACRPATLSLVTVRSGQRKPAVRSLFRGTVDAPLAVSISRTGRVLAAWSGARSKGRAEQAYAAVSDAHLRHMDIRALGPASAQLAMTAAIGASGRAVVAWVGERVRECHPESPATFRVAYAGSSGRWEQTRLLDRWDFEECGAALSGPGIQASVTEAGPAVVTWTSMSHGVFIVRAQALATSRRETTWTLSDPAANAVLRGMSTDQRGNRVAIWIRGLQGSTASGPEALVASAWTATGPRFGAPEQVSGEDTSGVMGNYTAGVSTAQDGSATAVWATPGGAAIATREPAM